MGLTGAAAARVTDAHLCPIGGTPPHVGGPILPGGCKTVLIGGQLAARVGDHAACAVSIDAIARGCSGVAIGGAAAARIGDPTLHGGAIVAGENSVLMGIPWQAELFAAAAAAGATFCLVCQDADGLPLLKPTALAATSAAGYAMRQAAERGDAYCTIEDS